ncbi:helicase-related protein, partial [Corynebacterium diphtheriae]|uniref:helicase-related protein n=1 Tax=Corynebacterium diphtheriae TaxID=1717 RepID=UPI0023BA0B38
CGEDLQIPPTVFPAAETVLPGQFNRTLIDSDSTTIDFTMEETSYDHLVESHVKWHQTTRLNAPHARIGLICNTVKRAQEIAAALEKTNDRIVLLHSRMTTEHRRRSAELLESLLGPNGNRKTITVVGTQAIEASLDIDLDILRTELCPAPSLVQRAGRVWRRNDPYRSSRITADHKPISVVFIAEAEDWQVLPYLRAETSRTQRWLEKHNQMFLPQMAQEFIDAATVDLDTATSEMDLDALALMGIHLMKADGAKARIQDVLNSDSKVSDFALLTSKNEIDEAQTRLIEEGTHLRIILGDENESIPGGWKHGLSSLLKLKASDRESLRTALLASIPLLVSEKQKQLLYQHNLVPLSSSKTVLAGFYFLPKAQNFYSKNLGFIWPEEKD